MNIYTAIICHYNIVCSYNLLDSDDKKMQKSNYTCSIGTDNNNIIWQFNNESNQFSCPEAVSEETQNIPESKNWARGIGGSNNAMDSVAFELSYHETKIEWVGRVKNENVLSYSLK